MEGLFRVCRKRGSYWAMRIAEMGLRLVLRRNASFLNFQLQMSGFSSLEAGSRLLLGQKKRLLLIWRWGRLRLANFSLFMGTVELPSCAQAFWSWDL